MAPPRVDFYQTETHVIASIFKKKLDESKVQVQLQDQHVHVDLGTGEPDEVLDYDLFAPIQPEQSSYKVLSTKLDLSLAKASTGIHWNSLVQGPSQPAVLPATSVATGAATSSSAQKPPIATTSSDAPASQRRGFSKWNVSGSLDELDSNEEAQDATDVDKFFKQLYAGASDETRRAMMKSYLESNGTALSTNWDEVSKGKVPVKPPSGMEPKSFEQ